jgi:hypothetical protein
MGTDRVTMCEACERGDHQNCGMQSWCRCENPMDGVASNKKKLEAKIPMCGYMAKDDEISIFPNLCTCPECLDWIRPDHDQSNTASEGKR